jgi:hypothetical protein
VPPLRRNRDFMLLQAGQLLSGAGSQSSTLAYPLLVLAATHSAAQAGLVSFAAIAPMAVFGLFAGAAADRWSRKRLMIAADVVRAAAIAALASAILLDRLALWQILLASVIEATATTFFAAAHPGALRAVVPVRQLPDAAGAQEARRAVVRLGGPPLGGALFAVGRAAPFLFDAASYACSTLALLAMRTPFQQPRDPAPMRLRAQIGEGLRYLWAQPFLRVTTFLYGIGNFIGPGVLLALVVVGGRQGLSSGEIGVLFAAFGAAALLGSVASPLFRRGLSIRAILLLELWTWSAMWGFLMWPSVYVLLAGIVPFGMAAPVTDSVINGYLVAMTPDRLLGRVESARRTISLLIAPLGPLLAGLLLSTVSARATIAAFAASGLALALWGTLSPSIRAAPGLDELEQLAG